MFRSVHACLAVALVLLPGMAVGQSSNAVKAGTAITPIKPDQVIAPGILPKIPPERIGDLLPAGNDLTLVVNGPGRVEVNGTTCKAKGSPPSALCQRSVAKGAAATLIPTPDDGYEFTGWAGACAGKEGRCFLTPTGAVQTAATFAKAAAKQMVKVSVTIPEGAGTVTTPAFAESAIKCTRKADGTVTGTCSGSFPMGTTIGLDAAPAVGGGLKGWQGTGGCEGMACSFKAQDPVMLTARFTDAPGTASETLNVMLHRTGDSSYFAPYVSPNASWTCSSPAPLNSKDSFLQTCKATFPRGMQVRMWAVRMLAGSGNPDQHVPTDKWTGDCDKKTATDCTITMSGTKTVIVQ